MENLSDRPRQRQVPTNMAASEDGSRDRERAHRGQTRLFAVCIWWFLLSVDTVRRTRSLELTEHRRVHRPTEDLTDGGSTCLLSLIRPPPVGAPLTGEGHAEPPTAQIGLGQIPAGTVCLLARSRPSSAGPGSSVTTLPGCSPATKPIHSSTSRLSRRRPRRVKSVRCNTHQQPFGGEEHCKWGD